MALVVAASGLLGACNDSSSSTPQAAAQSASTPPTATATLVSIAVTPAKPSVVAGGNEQFIATGTYSDKSQQTLTTSVTWSSSNTVAATVSSAGGLAKTSAAGTTTITATMDGVSGSTVLTVTPLPATLVSIAVAPANPSVTIGSTAQFLATGMYSDNSTQMLTTSVTWSSANAAVATISNAVGTNGLATANASGSTAISATLNGVTSPAVTLTVTPAATPQYVYVVNESDSSISQFTIGADGTLTPVGAPLETGPIPISLVFDATRQYAYVASSVTNLVYEYSVGAGGVLSALSYQGIPVTVATGNQPSGSAADPRAGYVYVANDDGTVSQYAVGTGGILGALTPPSAVAESNPAAVAVDPTGQFVFVANSQAHTVSQFTIGADGTLSANGDSVTDFVPVAIGVDPVASYVYVANSEGDDISAFSIGVTGQLTALGKANAGNQPTAIVVDPSGRFVYAANQTDNTISQYTISGASLPTPGALAPMTPATVATGNGPTAIAVDKTGTYVYVANYFDDTVCAYKIGAGGALSPIGTAVATGASPMLITMN